MTVPTLTQPAFRWVPPYTHTNGDIAAQVGEELGLAPDADQRDILDATFAYRPDEPDVPVCFSAATVAPRQNIKTSTWEIAALTDLFVFREPLQDWSAHLYDTASKTFMHMVNLIDGRDDYRRLCRSPYRGKGDQAIELLTGERIEFHSRSRGAGRGPTVPRRTLDEALFLQPMHMGAGLPTVATFRRAQIRYSSSSGLLDSAVLRGIRDRGRKGGDPRTAYFEWSTERRPCASVSCSHQFGTEGCLLDDREMWARANPAYGRRISEQTLSDLRREMPADEFAREFLGWWEDPPTLGRVLDADLWASLADPASTVPSVPVFAVDVNPEQTRASISVSGRRADGLVHVGVPASAAGVDWLRSEVPKLPGRVFVVKGSPAEALDLGRPVDVLSKAEYVSGCQRFFDTVTSKGLRYIPDVDLDSALGGAVKQNVGTEGAWCWSRKGLVDISPLVAATAAVTVVTRVEQSRELVVIY